MEIYTGYFSYTKKYIQSGLLPISIARLSPKWFDGLSCITFAPEGKNLWRYKESQINEKQYKKEYLDMLEHLQYGESSDTDIARNLMLHHMCEAKQKGYKGIIYLCYEKNGDFCHRHIFADYCNQKYNLNIKEYEI